MAQRVMVVQAAVLVGVGVLALSLAVHPFVTYPLSLAALARFRPRPFALATGVAARKVAICVCAYNEASVLGARIDNMLALRRTVPDLDVLVYVDGADDGTADVVRRYGDLIRFHISPLRQGKTYGMNLLLSMTDADLVAFSDANVIFSQDALLHLLAPFADDTVGCVCGNLIYTSRAGASVTAETGSLYWRLEERIKELESRTGSVMGADGSIFAIRRALHRPPPSDLIDDMYVSFSILLGGHRVVRAGQATAYEEIVSRPREEFRRKVRIACQAFNVHRALWLSFGTLSPLDLYKYVSHKLIRWLTIYLLGLTALCFVLALLLLGAYVAVAVLVGVIVAGVAIMVLLPVRPVAKIADIFAAFTATGLGVLRSLAGDRFQTWSPPGSARTIGLATITVDPDDYEASRP